MPTVTTAITNLDLHDLARSARTYGVTDVFIVHAGDSRAYLFHDGAIQRLTSDHTLVQMMVSSGLITPEDAASFYGAGYLAALQARYAGRGVEMVCVAGCWRFQTAEDLAIDRGQLRLVQ